jgi:hypothetical protein
MTALIEEFLEKAAKEPMVPGNIDGWAIVAGGKALTLPLAGACRIPPAE